MSYLRHYQDNRPVIRVALTLRPVADSDPLLFRQYRWVACVHADTSFSMPPVFHEDASEAFRGYGLSKELAMFNLMMNLSNIRLRLDFYWHPSQDMALVPKGDRPWNE